MKKKLINSGIFASLLLALALTSCTKEKSMVDTKNSPQGVPAKSNDTHNSAVASETEEFPNQIDVVNALQEMGYIEVTLQDLPVNFQNTLNPAVPQRYFALGNNYFALYINDPIVPPIEYAVCNQKYSEVLKVVVKPDGTTTTVVVSFSCRGDGSSCYTAPPTASDSGSLCKVVRCNR